MKVVIVLALLVCLAYCGQFSWKSCGDSDVATLKKLIISPDPLVFPGKVTYEAELEVKKLVQDARMEIKIVRNTFFLDITLPCVKQFGSCSHGKLCSFVKDMVKENWGDIGAKVGQQFLPKNADVDLCDAEISPQLIKKSGTLDIPELPSMLKFIAAGDYTVRVEVTSNTDSKLIACVEAKASLKMRGSVWGKGSRANKLF